MPWRVAALAPLVVVLVAAIWLVPGLTREREAIEASPQPPPLFTVAPITFVLGTKVCAGPLHIDADTDIARTFAGRFADGPPRPTRFVVTVRAPGYEARRDFNDYRDGQALDLPLPDPPRPLDDAQLCVQNTGSIAGLMAGSAEARTKGRLTTTIDGKPSDTALVVSLLAARPESGVNRLAHVAALKPSFAPPVVLFALAALVLLGLPLGAALVIRRSAAG